MRNIYVIGGANIDIFAHAKNKIVERDSNPSKISFSYGGVARNIVENLANLKAKVYFISCFGCDLQGKEMYKYMLDKGANLAYSYLSSNENTSTYIAILDNNNDLRLGSSDMSILDNLNINYLSKLKDVIEDDDFLFFDPNLKEETINYIVNNLKGRKFVDAISAPKAVKLTSVLNKIDVLKLNLIEAEAINGKALNSDEEIKTFILKLLNGNNNVLVTCSNSVFVGYENRVIKYAHDSYVNNPKNTTGAGDAFFALYLYAQSIDLSILDSVKYGLAAAILTVNDEKAVTDLNLDVILNKVKEIGIKQL